MYSDCFYERNYVFYRNCVYIPPFPSSPSFRAIIPRMTFASIFLLGGSKVIHRIIIAWKEGKPRNEANYVYTYIERDQIVCIRNIYIIMINF